jgi:hypothetical protein
LAITKTRQYFLDTLVECIGIKSGLAVTIPKAIELLDEESEGGGWWHGNPMDFVRLYPGELQDTFLELLYRVGAVRNTDPPLRLIVNFCRGHLKAPNPESPEAVMKLSMELNPALSNYLEMGGALSKGLAKMPGIDKLVSELSRRNIMIDGEPLSADWDGIAPLSDLFHSKNGPSDSSKFFDRRFIDYLNTQGHDDKGWWESCQGDQEAVCNWARAHNHSVPQIQVDPLRRPRSHQSICPNH